LSDEGACEWIRRGRRQKRDKEYGAKGKDKGKWRRLASIDRDTGQHRRQS